MKSNSNPRSHRATSSTTCATSSVSLRRSRVQGELQGSVHDVRPETDLRAGTAGRSKDGRPCRSRSRPSRGASCSRRRMPRLRRRQLTRVGERWVTPRRTRRHHLCSPKLFEIKIVRARTLPACDHTNIWSGRAKVKAAPLVYRAGRIADARQTLRAIDMCKESGGNYSVPRKKL